MKKEFLTDGEKVRFCDSNIAKMNVFEYWRHFGTPSSIEFKEYLKALGAVIAMPFMILFFPIITLIETLERIRRAKSITKVYEEKKS